jgi:hypothetical protein
MYYDKLVGNAASNIVTVVVCLLPAAAKSCASAPSAYLAPNSAGWDQSCAGGLIGAVCQAECGVNATGTAYTARCDDTNTWTITGGACKGKVAPVRTSMC